MDGIFLIDKPVGLTSRAVCNQVAKAYHSKKVGHVGTLDPFASGLLIVAMGKATKAVTFFDESIKEYVATIKLGTLTDTLDNTGKVIESKEVRKFDKSEIENVLNSFLGKSEQIPPMTSAIHVNGKRLYEYAHQGIEVDRPTREIEIYDIRLIDYDDKNETITFYSKVSKGTYIRSLGADIATKLGTVGYLEKLERSGVSPFTIKETNSLEDVLNKKAKIYQSSEVLMRLMESYSFSDDKILDIKNGKYTYLDIDTKEDRILIVDSSNNAIAVYQKDESNRLKFIRGLF